MALSLFRFYGSRLCRRARSSLIGFGHLLPQDSRLGIMTSLSLSILLLSLNSSHASCIINQPVAPVSIKVCEKFKPYDNQEQCDAPKLKEVVKPRCGFDGVPSGHLSHDDFLPVFFAVGAAFLAGFKIGKRLSRRTRVSNAANNSN
jgi:hypothetical protein